MECKDLSLYQHDYLVGKGSLIKQATLKLMSWISVGHTYVVRKFKSVANRWCSISYEHSYIKKEMKESISKSKQLCSIKWLHMKWCDGYLQVVAVSKK